MSDAATTRQGGGRLNSGQQLTEQQRAAIQSGGKVIVSASAGSGKTFVMIQKLVNAIAGGADLDEVLAVTFTKKAAAQMKEKLRLALIARLDGESEERRARLKIQLSKIPSANISTIHSFCAGLLRTYFYVLGIDGGFEIISADDSVAKELKARAMDAVFERCYEEDDSDFKLLLKRFVKKRSDAALKKLLDEAYTKLRATAHYEKLLSEAENLYTEQGFKAVCGEYNKILSQRYLTLYKAVLNYKQNATPPKNAQVYHAVLNEMAAALLSCASGGMFDERPPLCVTKKPTVRATDGADVKLFDEGFKSFRDGIAKKYKALCAGFEGEAEEMRYFYESGVAAVAFSRILMQFDREYAAVLRDENKLDYNDLEHMTLNLLQNDEVRAEINLRFKHVFVDEYQDVNPVQEEIISVLGGEVFLVGDVKQAIYGFRGSKSQFFAEKYNGFSAGQGTALKLSNNFRSADGVLSFVNALFCDIMRGETCGIDYKTDGVMYAGGGYPEGCGEAHLHIFGADEEEQAPPVEVYSVANSGQTARHTREGLAVLKIVERELSGKHFDLKTGAYVDTQPGDICILTRKNKGDSTDGIVRALRDEGYLVSGAQQSNICELPEVKQFLDVLSLIDNAEQDFPLISALLSPLGGFCEDELAQIRIALKKEKNLSFRDCCKQYMQKMPTPAARKLDVFWEKLEKLRSLSEILNTGELADEILENYGLEAAYGIGSGEKLKNVLRLVSEGASLPLAAFLQKIKSGGFEVPAPAAAPSDSIKIMSMHAAKGLEFPVVIIADICRTFKGADYSDVPFDEKYGFAPKWYDTNNMLVRGTVLRGLCKLRAEAEELKNELNLFYVACTRAMCNLHILAEEVKPFDGEGFWGAKRYCDFFDMQKFNPEQLGPHEEFSADGERLANVFAPDAQTVEEIEKRFMVEYSRQGSVDLPVKSSASAILKARSGGEEPYFCEPSLFGGEDETGTDRGTAYHRFLELCDFSKKRPEEVEAEIKNFVLSGRLTAAQAELLNAGQLTKILNMPVFEGLSGAQLFREQEFLCRLPACEILPDVTADDEILVQGAIDLLARGDFGVKIIDYKYSKKNDGALIKSYSPQLQLYKRAAAKITGISPNKISLTIVNIFLGRQINL